MDGSLWVATVVALMVAAPASAATLTVNTTSDTNTPDDGICSLREAIAAADAAPSGSDCGSTDASGNTIMLPASSAPYALTIATAGSDDNTTGDLDATSPVPLTIQGAGAGRTTVDASGLHDRILHVLAGASVTIADLTLSGGHAVDGTPGVGADTVAPGHNNPSTAGGDGANGGAILNNGTLRLSDLLVTGDHAGDGGAGGSASGSPKAASNGGRGGAGGAVFNSGALDVEQVTFSDNRSGDGGTGGSGVGGGATEPGADGGCCGDGGAIDSISGSVTISGSLFTGNHAGAGGSGGAGGDAVFVHGSASSGGQGQGGSSGGAIASSGGAVAVSNTTFTVNDAGPGGNGGSPSDSANQPQSNANGGGAGNGSAGGAIWISAGSLTLDSATISANQPGQPGTPGVATGNGTDGAAGAPAFAGGVDVTGTATASFANVLLNLNLDGNCHGTITDSATNLSFGDGSCPNTFRGDNPLLGPLADNGGPTQTMALGAGSKAINAGTSCPPTDQRGVLRNDMQCDIGAYEVTAPVATAGPADGITSNSATLHGGATANAGSASAHFEIGTTTAYGTSTPDQTIAGVTPLTLSAVTVTGLTPSTAYHYRVVATSPDGTSDSADATFTTAATGPSTPAAPVLSAVKVSHATFSRHRHGHATITYSDSEVARTTIVVSRILPGARRHGRCVKRPPHSHAARCTRLATRGSFTHADKGGRNALSFNGELRHRTLPAGTYALQLTPRASGLTGRTVTVRITIR